MAVINVHGGHNPEGRVACGAKGILDESREDRIVKDKVIRGLRAKGHTVYDCTVDDGTSQADVLRRIVEKCNAHTVDVDLSIHFNSGRNDYVGDGSVGGTEVFLYNLANSNKLAIQVGKSVVEEISGLGFRIRDDAIPDHVKTDSQLYVLRNTKAPAVLIECCFVDDMDDAKLYDADKMANAIINGVVKVLGGKQTATKPSAKPTASASKPAQTTTHKVGGTVSYNKIFKTATSTSGLKPRKTSGVITKVLKGKANPYLIDGGTGWINDSCITGGATTAPAVNYYPAYTAGGNSITMALKSMGIDSSMAHRKQIAASNNIGGYTGTYTQNVTMLTLLKQGRLVAA